jgi:transcriptional regulator with XRE-family HTH domain
MKRPSAVVEIPDDSSRGRRHLLSMASGPGARRRHQATGTVIRRARKKRQWTQLRAATELRDEYRRRGLVPPELSSLTVMVSRWEGGHQMPGRTSRVLLCRVLDIPLNALKIEAGPQRRAE